MTSTGAYPGAGVPAGTARSGPPADATAAAVEEPVDVMVVEDHALLAQSLLLTFGGIGLTGVLPLPDPAEVLAMAQRHRPQVVLLDLDLGSGGDGTELVMPLTVAGARVIAVTGSGDRLRLAAALERGAVGALPKSVPLEDLLDAVRRALRGEEVLSPVDRSQLLTDLRRARAARRSELRPFAALTPRERFVLGGLIAGRSAGDIAARAVVSETTVRSQIRGVLTKLGVTSQLAAVGLARSAAWDEA